MPEDYIKKGTGAPTTKVGDTVYFGDAAKQVPGEQPPNAYDRASTPANCDVNKTPNYVFTTAQCTDNIGFWFGSSSSFAEYSAAAKVLKGNYTIVAISASAGYKFNMHPTAISGSTQDIARIRLVYNSALSTGGR